MSVEGVQMRIAQLQSMMAAASATSVMGPTSTGVKVAGTGAVTAASGAATAVSGTAFAAALNQAVDAGQSAASPQGWVRPSNGSVSSEYGPRWGTQHEGMDFAAGMGQPIKAAADGVVKKASWYGGYGNAVIIDHGNGVQTLYGHASKLNVEVGQKVKAGETIAKIGSTGDSTGPHLHFEVEVNGKPVNPRPWLKKRGVEF